MPFVTLIAYTQSPDLTLEQLRNGFSHTLLLTETPIEAAVALTSQLFNLIIVDLALSEIDLLALVKNPDNINCGTPILALVDKVNPGLKKDLIAAGFDDCLTKPLTAASLDETIQLWQKNEDLSAFINSTQVLLANCRNNRSLALTLYSKLFDTLPQKIAELEAALKAGQYDLAFETTHYLNGLLRTCYLYELQDLATHLEKCLIQNSHEFADGYFSMFRQSAVTFLSHQNAILDHLWKHNRIDQGKQ
jgi:CheY-like chemotaxis protein